MNWLSNAVRKVLGIKSKPLTVALVSAMMIPVLPLVIALAAGTAANRLLKLLIAAKDVPALQAHIASLEDASQQTEEALEAAQARISQLQSQVTQLQRDLTSMENQYTILWQEYSNVTAPGTTPRNTEPLADDAGPSGSASSLIYKLLTPASSVSRELPSTIAEGGAAVAGSDGTVAGVDDGGVQVLDM